MFEKIKNKFKDWTGQEEEAKELPKIDHEEALNIAGWIAFTVFFSFDELDRVKIAKWALPINDDRRLKNIFLDSRRFELLVNRENFSKQIEDAMRPHKTFIKE